MIIGLRIGKYDKSVQLSLPTHCNLHSSVLHNIVMEFVHALAAEQMRVTFAELFAFIRRFEQASVAEHII